MLSTVSSADSPAAVEPITREPARQFDLISTYSTRNLGDAAIMRAIASLVPGGAASVALDRGTELHLPGLNFSGMHQGSTRISVGGDIFNNARPHFVTRSFLTKLAELGRAPQRTISFGQTIPSSCEGLSLKMLTYVLRHIASVTVRDTESYGLLKSAGIDAALSWDVAFVTETTVQAIARASSLLGQHGLTPNRTALLSVRPFDAMYPADQQAVDRMLFGIATSLLDRGHHVALLIQSDVASWDEDRSSAARIAQADPRIKIIDCLQDREDTDPVATLTALLNLANIAIGIRYHTTILRLAGGRMPFNLYYSRKGADLQRRLHLAGCHVSQACSKATIDAIEATASAAFDPGAIRRDIRDHFAEGLRRTAT
jgi:polysaccharide pyruvyl transferase WcaK-like protein